MKKTLTVNLGGTVFHIDEDAYQLLDKYLSNLRIHFRKVKTISRGIAHNRVEIVVREMTQLVQNGRNIVCRTRPVRKDKRRAIIRHIGCKVGVHLGVAVRNIVETIL